MLGLVMIVRNGAETIEACLASLRPHIGAWTICDTGSTDGTPDLIEAALAGIPGALHRDDWVNFGHNRSLAFARARGTADWLLASDADMTWTIDEGWTPDPAVEAYMVDMGGDPGFANALPLMLRGDLPWRSVGAVHEYTTHDEVSVTAATDAVRIAQPGGRAWTPEKGRWHVAMLEAELFSHPDNPRTTFYLAKTCEELGSHDRARKLYERRVAMGGPPEETYYAAWRAAILEPDWARRAAALMAAWELRPARLEALHDLVAELNQRGQHHTAWALASVVTPPCADSLFIHRWIWDYGLLFQHQIAAWWVGSPAFAAITERLLSLDLPSDIRSAVERNASLRAA
jgi:hypothetical protein